MKSPSSTLTSKQAGQKLSAAQQQVARFPASTGVTGAVVACPLAKPAAPNVAKIVQAPKPQAPAVVCRLQSAVISCSHDRQSNNGLLAVVGDSTGDKITGKATMDGGCGQHLQWIIAGALSDTRRGTTVTFAAGKGLQPAIQTLTSGWFGIGSAQPQIYRVNATACEGGAEAVEIRAYPGETLSIKGDWEGFSKALKGHFKLLPISEANNTEIEKSFFVPAYAFEQKWQEDDKTPRVYCENSLSVGCDPLIGLKVTFPLWSPIPPWIDKWVKFGIYLGIDADVAFKVSAAWKYWPDVDKSDSVQGAVALDGNVTARLSFDIFVAADKVVKFDVAGETGLDLEGSWHAEQPPYGEVTGEWTGLDAMVTVGALWGLVEYERTWAIWHPNVKFTRTFGPGSDKG